MALQSVPVLKNCKAHQRHLQYEFLKQTKLSRAERTGLIIRLQSNGCISDDLSEISHLLPDLRYLADEAKKSATSFSSSCRSSAPRVLLSIIKRIYAIKWCTQRLSG